MDTFGQAMRAEWLLDPAVTYLNHGTVGATPRKVLEFQRALIDEIERHPARFMLRELADVTSGGGTAGVPRMRAAAARVAEFVGAAGEDLVFVDNITTAANAVLRSFPLRPGDEIAITSLGYGGVNNAAHYAARQAGAAVRTIEIPQPGAAPEAYRDAIVAGLSPATRILICDHITAGTALILPLAEIATACRERGVLIFADGAHAPGQIPLDIPSLGVDWYAGNLHKWAWTPRSAGLLWTHPDHQPTLHPTTISWGLDHGIAAEFDLLGTRDPSTYLSAPFAIDLMRSFGLDDVYRYNHDLAWWAGRFLADRWGVPFTTPESMVGSMVNVLLPPAAGDHAETVRAALDAAGFEVPIYTGPNGLSTRVSAQIYNERGDIERLGDAVAVIARR